jgi:homoserine kinase
VVKLRAAGIPATISGAGPTVLALANAASAGRVEGLAGARFATQVLAVDQDGAAVVPLTE